MFYWIQQIFPLWIANFERISLNEKVISFPTNGFVEQNEKFWQDAIVKLPERWLKIMEHGFKKYFH